MAALLTFSEFARELGVSHFTVYSWNRRHRLKGVVRLPGGSLRIRREELDRLLVGDAE